MRNELKYLVRESDRDRLLRLIAPYVVPDAHATVNEDGVPGYTVRSIYFDSPGLRDWAEKESGDEIRRKVRVRGYDRPGSSLIYLEIKRKQNMAVWKDRVPLAPEAAAQILSGDAVPPGLPQKTKVRAERFIYRLRAEHRRPVLLVTYDREPWVGRFDPSLRVTLDRRLRVSSYPSVGPRLTGLYADRQRPILDGRFILEVKYDRVFPSWLRHVQAMLRIRQQALSKYGMGIQAEVDATPWRFGRPAVSALAS